VSAADLAAYPSIWFLRKWGGAETERWLPIKPLIGWVERVAALRYGHPTEIAGTAALDIARKSTPAVADLPADGDPSGLKAGTKVSVTPDNVGRDPAQHRPCSLAARSAQPEPRDRLTMPTAASSSTDTTLLD
jgi:hypothetical protein